MGGVAERGISRIAGLRGKCLGLRGGGLSGVGGVGFSVTGSSFYCISHWKLKKILISDRSQPQTDPSVIERGGGLGRVGGVWNHLISQNPGTQKVNVAPHE